MPVTAIERHARRQKADVFVDGSFALSLSSQVIREQGLEVGSPVDLERIAELHRAELRYKAWQTALRLLSYRPRSEVELRRRLAGKGLPQAIVHWTIERLTALSLVDDQKFVGEWVESRNRASPRSRRMLAHELQLKGINRQLAATATESLSDEEAAYRAAQSRAHRLRNADYTVFQKRLGDFLLRRGFGYELTSRIVKQLWQELGNSPSGEVPIE